MKPARTHALTWLTVVLFTTCGACLAQGQTETSPPNIQILELKWQKDVRLPRNFDPSAIPTGTTFNDPRGATGPITDSRAAIASSRNPTLGTEPVGFPPVPQRLPVFYTYTMKIRNVGEKIVDGIAWDYAFFDVTTNAERGRHSFLSFEKLTENKNATLKGQLRSPPVRIIHASNSSEIKQSQFRGQAIIQCILYADDTVWKNVSAPADICALLKTERSLLKHKRSAT